jgi:hypothetical protein
MSLADAQARLAERQEELLRALTGQGPLPAGFDPARVEATSTSLVRKRLRAVAEVWPRLAAALGEHFADRFLDFARRTTLPCSGGALADGRAFARELAVRGQLPDDGRLEALGFDLRYRVGATGLVRRRGFGICSARWRYRRGRLLGVRLPWGREVWITIPV